jgi:hypothetical protein
MGYHDSSNLYAGFANDPVNNNDPTGEYSATAIGGAAGFTWGVVQMLVAGARDALEGEVHGWDYYVSIWGQNTVGGLELGASIDVGLMSGGFALPTSGALGGAGFDALTFSGRPQEWGEFGRNQAASAAFGAVSGPLISKALPLGSRFGSWALSRTGVRRGVSRLGASLGTQIQRLASSPAVRRGLQRFSTLGGQQLNNQFTMRAMRASINGGRALARRNPSFPRGIERRELSHWLIPHRASAPNWLKNGRWNFRPMWGTDHALADPVRHGFLPATWKAANPLPNVLVQFWNRTPAWAQGAFGGTVGTSGLDLVEESLDPDVE